jgi:hypothetical protein
VPMSLARRDHDTVTGLEYLRAATATLWRTPGIGDSQSTPARAIRQGIALISVQFLPAPRVSSYLG